METLMPKNSLHFSYPLLSPPLLPSSVRSVSRKTAIFPRFPFQRRSSNLKIPSFCTITVSSDLNSSSCGGWDDPGLLDDANLLGTLDKFRSFLVSIGIDDEKHTFLFCLGFLSALAVARVRLSTIVVLPISVLVFVAGLSAGVARGGVVGYSLMEIGRNQRNVRLSNGKMKILRDFLDELGVKIADLKNGLARVVDWNHVEVGEIKRYLDVIESVGLATMPVKKIVQDYMEIDFSKESMVYDLEAERKSNPKSNKKRKELGMVGFDVLRFLGGLFQEGLIGQKAPKANDSIKREVTERSTSTEPLIRVCVDSIDEITLANEFKEKVSNLVPNNNLDDIKMDSFPQESFGSRSKKSLSLGAMERKNMPEMVKSDKSELSNENPVSSEASTINGKQAPHDDSYDIGIPSYSEDLNNPNRSFRFMSTQGSYHKMILQHQSHKSELRRQQSKLHDSAETGFSSRTRGNEIVSSSTEAEASHQSEQTVGIHDKAHFPKFPSHDRTHGKVKSEEGTQNTGFREGTTKSEDQTILGYQHSRHDVEAGNRSLSSSTISVDEEFNRNVKEATDLLKQTGECFKGQGIEETAELRLHKSARLLSTAVAMKPTSLLALGQLGNTFLLHGELKLKMSRELRAVLCSNDSTLIGKGRHVRIGELSNRFLSKEKVTSILVDVCEECELLIEAGRKYRMVLSIDENDARALYNWGLALSFRAQLIADIGPEAAFDADRVYLAAIDKFDAMVSRSNDHAPDALFRWGLALQQRSQLHRRSSKEKMKLLRQAKSLFEDVLLRAESDNPHVRKALFTCISELNFSRQLE